MRRENEESGSRKSKVFPAVENVFECLCSQNEKDKEVLVRSFSDNMNSTGRSREECEMGHD